MNILLDYIMPISAVEPTPQASTGFLKRALVVAKPKSGQEGNVGTIYQCNTMAQVTARTDNTESQQLFNAGLTRVELMLANDLNLATFLVGKESDFFTILISSDFDKDDVTLVQASGIITVTDYADLISGTDDVVTLNGQAFTAQTGAAALGDPTFQAATSNEATAISLAAQINAHPATKDLYIATVVGAAVTVKKIVPGTAGNNTTLTYTDNDTNVGIVLSGLSAGKLSGGAGLDVGAFKGMVAVSETDDAFLKTFASADNRLGMHTTTATKAKNMFFAFGKYLSALDWSNQQFILMPFADDVNNLGIAESLFDDRISFVITDDQYNNRLAFFVAGGKAITAPYVKKNLMIDQQSAALGYIAANQPAYTPKQATLLEDTLQDVINGYIARELIASGNVDVLLREANFVATGLIEIPDPNALWRIKAEMRQQ